jgi:hypothetical protein
MAHVEHPDGCLPFPSDVFEIPDTVHLDPSVGIFSAGQQRHSRALIHRFIQTWDEQGASTTGQIRDEQAMITACRHTKQRTRRISADPVRDQPFLGQQRERIIRRSTHECGS